MMGNMGVLLLVVVLSSVVVLGKHLSYSDCGTDSTWVNNIDIEVSPWPLRDGAPSQISVNANLKRAMNVGSYDVSASIWGFRVYDKTGSLNDLKPLPWKAGKYSVPYSFTVPKSAPTGNIDLRVKFFDEKATSVCVQFTIDIDSKDRYVNDDLAIALINSHPESTWTAARSTRFEGYRMSHVKNLCGTKLGMGPELGLLEEAPLPISAIPETFDARIDWGSMCPSVDEIRDQSNCGSCWAVSAASTMTDRLCIASKGKKTTHLSSEELVSCCGFLRCGFGCHGGFPSGAWSYWQQIGIVSGGPYNSSQGCYPYELPSCEHAGIKGHLPSCGSSLARTPRCVKRCHDGESWSAAKTFGSSSYRLSNEILDIQSEILRHGPVQAAFTVYADFPSYKSGVYQHLTGSALGGHAVKIIGWGVEKGTPYWLVANSWRADWGDHGFFKIRRGHNECGIERSITAGLPELH